MPNNFLVIRIHPDSPVDGGTFSTYLDGLQIKVFLAGSGTLPTPTSPGTATLLGETTDQFDRPQPAPTSVGNEHLCHFGFQASGSSDDWIGL